MPLVDVHQHLWTEPLLEALQHRQELPFVRMEQGLVVLHLAGEHPYVIDVESETPAHATALLERDGLERALICLSSPIGIEMLSRAEALPLLDAYHEGALALGEPFGVWGAVSVSGYDTLDVDRVLERGCVGISLPAGALASAESLSRLGPLLSRLEALDAPLLIHPGPSSEGVAQRLHDPMWWPALTGYVAQMTAAWLAFVNARPRYPRLRAIFTMLAGLGPLQAERLSARGGPTGPLSDPLIFYETSSYGPHAVGAISQRVTSGQLLYGSDRPVVEPALEELLSEPLSLDALCEATDRALSPRPVRSPELAL